MTRGPNIDTDGDLREDILAAGVARIAQGVDRACKTRAQIKGPGTHGLEQRRSGGLAPERSYIHRLRREVTAW
jgi:hypothetical protein